MRRFARFCSACVALCVFASVLVVPPAGAQETPELPRDGEIGSDEFGEFDDELPELDVPVVALERSSARSAVIEGPAPDVVSVEADLGRGWGNGGVATAVAVSENAGRQVGSSPVSVRVDRADLASVVGRNGDVRGGIVAGSDVARVRVNVLDSELAGQLSPFAAVASVGFEDAAGVEVVPAEPFELSLDLSEVSLGNGGANVYERLTVTRFENCELFTPSAAEVAALAAAAGVPVAEFNDDVLASEVICDATAELDAEFDVETRTLTAVVDVPEIVEAQAARERVLLETGIGRQELDAKAGRERSVRVDDVDALTARGASDVKAFGLEDVAEGVRGQSVGSSRVSLAVSAFTLGLVAQTGGSGPTGAGYGVTSSANSSSGDFSALPAPTLTEAQVGLFTGSAETSYPIPAPPAAAGPEPSVAFVYSSASVDGLTMDSNNQGGPLGVGWSLSAGGSIQRQLQACNDPAAPGDRCISSAPDDVYSLSLAGRSSTLVRIDSGGANANPKEFRLQSDPFWRIKLWRDNNESNPTFNNEWWSVETPDGTVFRLGTSDDSVDWLPVWYPSGGCTETYALCDTARQWNLTTTTDVFGNQVTYEYNQEENWYNARGISTAFKLPYVRSSNLETITYGGNPSENRPANARIVLNWEQRCAQSSHFGACGTYPGFFNDTPTDLWCGPFAAPDEYPTVCTEQTPTFWTHLRVAGVLSQVAGGNGTSDEWVTVAHHDPDIAWTRDTSVPLLDSEWHQVVRSVAERPVDGNNTAAGGTFDRNGFDTLWARSRDSQSGTGLIYNPDIGTDTMVSSMHSGDWIKFEDVWLGQDSGDSAARVTLRASGANTGSFNVRTGSPTGPILATHTFTSSNLTAHARDLETFTLTIPESARVHGVLDVYVTADSGSGNIGWLSFIQFGRPGDNANINSLPSVGQVVYNVGGFDFRDNRLNHPAGVSAMRFARINHMRNQLGGETEFTYGQNQPCATGVAVPPGSWDNNRLDCFPQWDASPAGTANDGWAIFNKWTVQSIRTSDDFSNQPDVQVNYTYTDPGWGFADNPDSNFDTWNEFRGYNQVVADSTGTGRTETRFHQGLDGEPRVGGGTWSRSVERSDGHTISDHYALRGQAYETRQLTDSNNEITRSWTTFANTATTTGNTNRLDPRFVAASVQEGRTDGTARTRTNISYNDWGQALSVVELGDQSASGDERTTATRYYSPTTTAALGSWRGTFPCSTETLEGTNTAVPTTNNNGNSSIVVRWSRDYYDGATGSSCGRVVVEPVVTLTRVAHNTSINPSQWLSTFYEVDASGRVDKVIDPNGNTTTTEYDDVHGQVAEVTNTEGWTVETEYDDWRRSIEVTDINDRTSETFYDEYSRVTSIRDARDASLGNDTVQVTYNQTVRPATVQTETRIHGNDYTKQVAFYDGFGRNVLTRSLAPEAGNNYATAVRYNNAGLMQRQSSTYTIANDNITTFAYPAWDSVPSFTQIEYDDASRPTNSDLRKGVDAADVLFGTSTEYFGFRTRFRDEQNVWTDSTIDGLGRTIEVKEQLDNLTTSFDYNAAGDLLEVTAPDGEDTTTTYDRAGRKLTSVDPDSGQWSYSYDRNSNLTSQTDPSGDVTAITYDDLGRRLELKVDGISRGEWVYDPTGNLGLLSEARQFQNGGEGDVVQLAEYDGWGRSTGQETRIPDHVAGGTGQLSFRTEYTLRDDGQPSIIHHPSGTNQQVGYKVDYTYNPRTGQAEGLAEQSGSGGETIVSDVTWDHDGNVFEIEFGAGLNDAVSRWYRNDNTGRVFLDAFGTNATPGLDRSYRTFYDDSGNITHTRDLRNSIQIQCFSYDDLDRLTSAYTDNTTACNGHTAIGDGNYNHTYAYDAGGNITEKTGTGAGTHTGTYSYDDSDHAHAVTSTSDGSTFSYNADGDLTLRNLAGQPAQTLVWDDGRRLESVTQSGDTTEFLYGIDDTRVRRKTSDDVYSFYHADGTEYTWDDQTSTGTFTYYHQIVGRTVAFTTSDDGVTTWMHADQVNSTSHTRDENGVAQTQRYTPFGEVRTGGNLRTDHSFTGQIEDETTGLSFYNARYYDPTIGRFVSPDTIIPDPGNGQDFNRYTYVRNNPIRYNDPTGHCGQSSNNYNCYDFGGSSGGAASSELPGVDRDTIFSGNSTNGAGSGPTGGISLPATNTTTSSFSGSASGCNDTFSFSKCGAHQGGIGGHAVLDGLGMIPVIGIVFDGANAAWYLVEGDYVGAGSSAVALIPVAGQGAIVLKYGDEASAIVRNADNAPRGTGVIDDVLTACRSFSADTGVLMADGTTTPIAEVAVGDEVLALNPETGRRAAQVVLRTLPHLDNLLVLETTAGPVWTTEDHLFWNVTDGEWQESQELDPGDGLLSSTGGSVLATELDWSTAHVDIAYDLDVSGFDTFFVSVGEESALVHNIECPWQLKRDTNFGNSVLDGPLPQTGQLSELTRGQLLDLQSDLTTSIGNRQQNLWDGTFPTDTQVFRDHAARVDLEVGLLDRVNSLLG